MVSALLAEFRAALSAHDARAAEPYSGPYHFSQQNDAIGALIRRIDPLLFRAKLINDKPICNDRRVRLLESLA